MSIFAIYVNIACLCPVLNVKGLPSLFNQPSIHPVRRPGVWPSVVRSRSIVAHASLVKGEQDLFAREITLVTRLYATPVFWPYRSTPLLEPEGTLCCRRPHTRLVNLVEAVGTGNTTNHQLGFINSHRENRLLRIERHRQLPTLHRNHTTTCATVMSLGDNVRTLCVKMQTIIGRRKVKKKSIQIVSAAGVSCSHLPFIP
jgi:hypothetical protein